MKATGASNLRQSWAERRRDVQPKTIHIEEGDLVETGTLGPGRELPLVITPRLGSVDLPSWMRDQWDTVETALDLRGGVLFRGFHLRGQEGFTRALDALPFPLMHYMEGATPRTELRDKVYTSTEFPPDQSISLHTELCYVNTWPMRILFFCDVPPSRGGATPIADVRRVYHEIDPEVREAFEEKGWMLVRNFSEGFGLPWQVSYRITDPRELERYFDSAGISYEWLDGGARLRTRQVRPVVERHPRTDEKVWFSHVGFWHVSSLDPQVREVMLRDFGLDGLPYHTCYGDGTSIPDEAIAEVRAGFDRATVSFPWEEGDLLLLDNMLVAHGREPFEGQRRILTAMGRPQSRIPVE